MGSFFSVLFMNVFRYKLMIVAIDLYYSKHENYKTSFMIARIEYYCIYLHTTHDIVV